MCILFLMTGLPNIFYSEVIDSRPKSYMWKGRKRSKTCAACALHLFACLQSCLQKKENWQNGSKMAKMSQIHWQAQRVGNKVRWYTWYICTKCLNTSVALLEQMAGRVMWGLIKKTKQVWNRLHVHHSKEWWEIVLVRLMARGRIKTSRI